MYLHQGRIQKFKIEGAQEMCSAHHERIFGTPLATLIEIANLTEDIYWYKTEKSLGLLSDIYSRNPNLNTFSFGLFEL